MKWINMALLMAALGLTSLSVADDDKKDDKEAKDPKPASIETKVRVVVAGKHWIGVVAHPIDDALKAQLGIKDRVIVHHVAPNSPSEKAGLKEYDILLSYGGNEVASIEDLMKAVKELGDKEAKLIVLRAGKETTLNVKPEDRPADAQLKIALPHVNAKEVQELILSDVLKGDAGNDGNKIVWRALGPAVGGLKLEAKAAAFPNNMSLSITKENDKPAQIVVKKDGKTYETTEDKLGELPEDVRVLVERSVRGPRVVSWSASSSDGPPVQLNVEQLHKTLDAHRKQALEHAEKAKAEALKAIPHRIEVRRSESGSLDDLRKDIEGLRKEIQELRKSNSSESKESK
jgi:membrane-associated protease RseP (regulator of RpoE activity)